MDIEEGGEGSGSVSPARLISHTLTSQVVQKDLPVVPGPFQPRSLFSFTRFFSTNEVAQVAHAPFSPVPARGLSLSLPLILGISSLRLRGLCPNVAGRLALRRHGCSRKERCLSHELALFAAAGGAAAALVCLRTNNSRCSSADGSAKKARREKPPRPGRAPSDLVQWSSTVISSCRLRLLLPVRTYVAPVDVLPRAVELYAI